MIRNIYKFKAGDRLSIIAIGTLTKCVQLQAGTLVTWIEISNGNHSPTHEVQVLLTGAEVPRGAVHLGTYQSVGDETLPYSVQHLYLIPLIPWIE